MTAVTTHCKPNKVNTGHSKTVSRTLLGCTTKSYTKATTTNTKNNITTAKRTLKSFTTKNKITLLRVLCNIGNLLYLIPGYEKWYHAKAARQMSVTDKNKVSSKWLYIAKGNQTANMRPIKHTTFILHSNNRGSDIKNVVINNNGAETTHNKISKTVCNKPESIGHSKRQNTNIMEIKQTLRSILQVATKACK